MIEPLRRAWRGQAAEVRSLLLTEGDDWRSAGAAQLVFILLALLGRFVRDDDGQPWMSNPWIGLAIATVTCAATVLQPWISVHNRVSDGGLLIAVLSGTSGFQLALLELANATRGTFLYGIFFIYVFTASAQAWRIRSRPSRPFILVSFFLALAIVSSHAASHEHLGLYGFMVLWSPAMLMLGHYHAAADAALAREAALRQENATLALELERRQVDLLEVFLEEIAGRTHDIGGPALALEMAIERAHEAMERGAEIAVQRDALEQAKRHIEDLRDRLRRAKAEVRSVSLPPFESVEVREVARAVVEGLHLRYGRLDVELADNATRVAVRGGRLALARVLENLADNGARAAEESEHPRLRLAWQEVDGAVELTVEDNGSGFDPSMPVSAAGTGVGLLSARRIVAISNGTLDVARSEVLGGARCVVRLDAASDEAA